MYKKSWTISEKMAVEDALVKLFALQDRPLTEDKKNFLIQELSDANIPAGAVISGIKYLSNEDLKSIKFITLKDAAHKFISHVLDDYQCQHCKGHGVVRMKKNDPLPHDTYLGCICTRGEIISNANGIIRWNGEGSQMNGEFNLVRA